MRLAKFALFLASLIWPAAGVAQESAELGRTADMMVRLCLGGGHTESTSGGEQRRGRSLAAVARHQRQPQGRIQGQQIER